MVTKPSIFVLLPASLTVDASNLRQKTEKVGIVGRVLAIFRVEKVCIYNDDDPEVQNQEEESNLIVKLLQYMETPQYLRKLIFPRARELRYAGLLPPLRTPHHPLRDERTKIGDYREGVVVESSDRGSVLELGLRERGVMDEKFEVGKRLTVRLGKRLPGAYRRVFPVERSEIGEYWGFEVLRAESLVEGLEELRAEYRVGTSRYGQNLYGALELIRSSNPDSVAIALGGPNQGLHEICERQGADPSEVFNVIVNAIPDQGVETVRTEEALLATLALLNALLGG
ncbi:MAG: hypothetical protein J7J17_02110 [Hadesarchaea archaeon]|nr:hypothetical protein [Hadesarchaea archaeon]